ncbi:hypothetical protein CGRA01v4_11516 [Colletotrichum graminicola]|nr:hypothetical protein CGRA01v4_11516 [Colletotrichum graminicola]
MRDVIVLASNIRRCGVSACLCSRSFPLSPQGTPSPDLEGLPRQKKKVAIRPISSKGKTRRRRRVAPAIISHHHPTKLRALGFRERELKRALAAGYLGLILQQQYQLSSENRIGQE